MRRRSEAVASNIGTGEKHIPMVTKAAKVAAKLEIRTDNRNTFAEACMEIVKYLKNNPDKLHTPNSIAIKTNVNRQTVEKAIKFMESIQSSFFDAYELDIEEMDNNRKIVGVSNRRKFSEYPIELQKQEIKKHYPAKSEEEINALFKKPLVH